MFNFPSSIKTLYFNDSVTQCAMASAMCSIIQVVKNIFHQHYDGVIMDTVASQITSPTIVYSTVFGRGSKKTSELRVTGLCAGNSQVTGEFPHKWLVTRKMFPFDDVIMNNSLLAPSHHMIHKWLFSMSQYVFRRLCVMLVSFIINIRGV